MDWLQAAPYMEPFVTCLAANRVLHYAHPSLASQVWEQHVQLEVQAAWAGFALYCFSC